MLQRRWPPRALAIGLIINLMGMMSSADRRRPPGKPPKRVSSALAAMGRRLAGSVGTAWFRSIWFRPLDILDYFAGEVKFFDDGADLKSRPLVGPRVQPASGTGGRGVAGWPETLPQSSTLDRYTPESPPADSLRY